MRRLAVLIAFLLIAPAAHADSIVFRRGGDVWRMAPDGTGQRQLTSGGGYEWPSAADDGTFAASDATGQVHRWTAAGAPLNVIPVATSTDEDAPTETPTHVRLSPDGARVAYDQAIEGDVTTVVTGADAAVAALTGQDGFIRPSWIGNERLLLSRDVSFDSEGTAFSTYALGAAVAPWFSDPGLSWASGFDAAASRDGSRLAVVADDSAESEGAPTRVVLRLYAGTTVRCELGLEAADTFVSASPSLSPDGSRVAWAESDGIHVAGADCGGERVVTCRARGSRTGPRTRSRRRRTSPVDPGAAGEGAAAQGARAARRGRDAGHGVRARDGARRAWASAWSRGCSTMRGRTRCA